MRTYLFLHEHIYIKCFGENICIVIMTGNFAQDILLLSFNFLHDKVLNKFELQIFIYTDYL